MTADDIVQDTIERALKFSAQYERGTNLRAWVYQILFSVFVTRYRRTRREKNALRVLGSDPCAWTLPSPFAAPEQAASLTPTTQGKLDALLRRRSAPFSRWSISTSSPTAKRRTSSACPSAR